MLKKIIKTASIAAVIAFAAANPTIVNAANVDLAAVEQHAEHEAFNIVHHLKGLAEEGKKLEHQLGEMKKGFEGLRKKTATRKIGKTEEKG